MDLRKQRESSSPFMRSAQPMSRDSHRNFKQMDQGNSKRQNAPGAFDSFNKKTENSPYGHNMRSPSYEEALRIEHRHEELKRQIALKEKQLADMTGERESVNILRNRLGLEKSQNQDMSVSSILQSRKQLTQMDSAKRGLYSSVSPDQSKGSIMPNMVGMKSTTFNNRGVSHEKVGTAYPSQDTYGKDRKIPLNVSSSQQLQFHPTRIPARPVEQYNSNNSRSSPLRSKSRSKSRHEDDSYHFNPTDHSRRNIGNSNSRERQQISPYERKLNGKNSSNSPLRKTSPYGVSNHQIIEEAVESSDNQESSWNLQPQKVQSLRHGASGQPLNMNTYGTKAPNKINNLQYVSSYSGGDLNERLNENSMYSQQTAKAKPQQLMQHSSGLEPRDKLYRERIEAMTLDNQSLQRRLNQVSSELERIQRENEDLVREMNMTEGDVNRINSLLSNRDDVDAQNNIMQNDLERIKSVNIDLNSKLKEEELQSANVGSKLSHTQVQKKNFEIEMDNLNHDFNHKIQSYEEISRERVVTLQQLNNVNNELEKLNRDQLQYNHDNIDMEAHVVRLQNERRDLLANIERVTKKFDDAVQDLGRHRRNMDYDNDWHTKLIVTKNIFTGLELFAKQRKQHVFNEIAKYCEFDGSCHSKLRSFTNVILRLGQYKMRMGLNQWYDNALKPLKTREQNEDISIVIDCNRLQAKIFYAWRQYQRTKMDSYNFKTNAIARIWHHLERDATHEKKRALDIWKQKKGFQVHTLKFLRRIAKKREHRQMEQAIYAMKDYSGRLAYACRVKVLHQEFTKKMFLSQVFHQLKNQIRVEKQQRVRTLNSFLKAWQDYVIYNRHLMQSNMASIAFRDSNTKYTKRAVFQALLQHTESKKYALLDHAVKNDMNVAIDEHTEYNLKKNKKLLVANQLRACNISRDMIGKKLFSYFNKWKYETDNYRVTMQTTVRNRVLRSYDKLMRSFFDQWKKKSFDKVRRKKMKMVQELQMSQEANTNEALQGEKNLRVRAEQVRTSQRKMVDKTFRKLFFRNLQYAINRWKDRCILYEQKEDHATLVVKRMRNRFLRQAFDKYLAFYKRSIQHSKNNLRADHIAETLRLRELRKMYNAMCYYTKWRLRVKRIWHKVLYRFDYFQKQRAVKRWCANAHEKQQKKLMFFQDEMTNDINDLNDELQEFQINEHKQQTAIKSQNKNLNKKGYRQIANCFQRLYTNNTQQKFNIWKAKVRLQIHKEKIMRRSIEHYKKRYLEGVQRVFLKFLSDDRRRERLEEIKATQIENHDIMLRINMNNGNYDKFKHSIDEKMARIIGERQETQRKVHHTMEWMSSKNRTCEYRSRKRMIFEMWRHIGKQEKAFLYCVKNVLEKSMLKEGLEEINKFARNDDYTDKVQRAMRRWSLKSSKINLNDSFNKWKKFALTKVENNFTDYNGKLNQTNNEFEAFRKQVKKQNMVRCMNYFVEKDKQNIWRAWVNCIKHLKLVKQKNVEFHQRQADLRKVFAIKRWKGRAHKTRQCRTRNEQLIQQFQFKYQRSAFFKWHKHYKNVKRFCNSLSSYENLMRTKIVGDSFKTTKSFAVSKGLVISKNFAKGSEDVRNIIQNLYLKKLSLAFQRYKANCYGGDEKNTVLKTLYGKFSAIRMRDAFTWWKKRHELAELKQDLHDTGPVRAEYWTSMKQIDNLKQFMRDEHYPETHIEKFYNDVCGKNEYLMKKYITRLKIRQNPDRKILPIILDRWKGLTAIRKLLKHQFNFCANSLENDKADMQRAFKKWRNGPDQLAEELWRLPVNSLINLGLKTTDELQECGDSIAENQSINNHLVMQRDEFLNYYIKGQILAMALVRDRTNFVQMQGLSRWLRVKKQEDKANKLREIRDASYAYANLEGNQSNLDAENATLEKENEEMKQFTQDGAIIKLNLERLKKETDDIKTTIDGTEEDYQQLLEQNRKLLEAVEAEEAKVNDLLMKGVQNKFLAEFKSLKEAPVVTQPIATDPDETEEQKKKRLRMERLAKLNQNGAALR